jgi:hypothetical protein
MVVLTVPGARRRALQVGLPALRRAVVVRRRRLPGHQLRALHRAAEEHAVRPRLRGPDGRLQHGGGARPTTVAT